MTLDRRTLLGRGAALLATLALATGLSAGPALAQNADTAKGLVASTIDEVLALVNAPGNAASKASRLRQIMDSRASMPAIARAAAGTAWRQMNAQQQAQFVDAFSDYVSTIYARRFQEYNGQQIRVERVRDAGQKGLLVQSLVANGGAPIVVEWLVSDRSGQTAINDIIIEGVSLVLTQRQEIAQMFAARGNDVDKLIQALKTA